MEQQIFKQRRQQLFQKLHKGDIAIVINATPKRRNRDICYPFRPDSDFYYLTGVTEPNAIAVLIADQSETKFILFCQDKDPIKELWEGKLVGPKDACQLYGADEAYSITEFENKLPTYLAHAETVHYPVGYQAKLDEMIANAMQHFQDRGGRGLSGPIGLQDIAHHVHELRLLKSTNEIADLQHAVDVSVKGHQRVIEACQPGLMEYELAAYLTYEFTKAGCQAHAYPPIVAGGLNACVLHYVDNNAKLKSGDLLLVDAGAEYQYYAADITRTIPINGQFSAPQQAIYEIVLQTQQQVIEAVKPGVTFEQLNKIAVHEITQGLIAIGLLKGTLSGQIEQKTYQQFFMHGIGHWLGLDVHDVGLYQQEKQWRPLEENMVFTVEPGIYIAPEANVDEKWRGIAVRIEDDVCVSATGSRVLSQALPKTINDITHIMAA